MKGVAIWVVFFGLVACEQLYDFEEDKDFDRPIIISGYVDQSRGPYFVKISQAQIAGNFPSFIRGANVVLFDGDGEAEAFKEMGDGVYRCAGSIVNGRPGGTYHIEVQMPSGQVFRSVPETMPDQQATDWLFWREELEVRTSGSGLDFEIPVINLTLESDIPKVSDPVFFNWVAEESFSIIPTDFPDPFGTIPPPCYVTRLYGSERINIFTSFIDQSGTVRIEDILTRQIDDSFLTKHIFTIYQYAISESYYGYLTDVKVLVENNGSLFDAPPGQALGNLYVVEGNQTVQGYFHASLVDTTRVAVFPDQIETFIVDDCKYDGAKRYSEYAPHCLDCSNFPGSTYRRPDFWTKVY